MPDKLKQSIVLTANDAVVYESRDDDLDRFIIGTYTYGGKRRNNKRKSTKNGGRNRRMFSKRKQHRGI